MVYDIIFGGNTLVDCKGKVYAIDAGTEESIMFCEDKDGNVLLNCTVKDKYGDILVKVDNGSVIYVDDRYNLKKENDLKITFSIIALRSFTSFKASSALSRIRRSIDSIIKSWIESPVAFLISSRTLYFSTGTLILVDTVSMFPIKSPHLYLDNKLFYKNLNKKKTGKTNYFLSFWKLATVDLIISAFCPAASAASCKIPSLAIRTKGTPSLTRALIDLPVSSLIIFNKLYSSGGISTVTLVETNFSIKTPHQNEIKNYSFFFSNVTIATHLPPILSNSQIRLSPSFKSKWSLKGAGTVVLKLLAWFAFVNLVLKPDIKSLELKENYFLGGNLMAPLVNASIKSLMVLLNAPCLFLYLLFAFSRNCASTSSVNSGWKYIFPINHPPLKSFFYLLLIFFMLSAIYTYYLFKVITVITVKYLYYLNQIKPMEYYNV